MSTVLETARLALREFDENDAAFFMALANDADWLRYIGDRQVRTPAAARAYLATHYIPRYAADGFGFWMAIEKQSGQGIGMCGLIRRAGLDDADIGFAFLPAFRGRGYAREAAEATLAHARDVLKLKRVIAIATPDNAASIALLEKIGLAFERPMQLPGSAEKLSLFAIEWGRR